jgi:Ni/Fe-hydrogenase subunit HybB-like protein
MNTDINENYDKRLEGSVFNPLNHTSKGYYAFIFVLLAIIAWGGFAYITQLRYGLIVTGLNDVTLWGVYIVNFIFFIGISYAGTLVSAVLRLTGAKWRHPITRMAEVIAVVGVMIGGLMPVIDLGRPDRIVNLFVFGRLESPLVWDIIAITTYLTACLIFLYLPLIPDLAIMRDNLQKGFSPARRKFYTFLAAGWNNTPEQKRSLDRGMRIMSIIIIPIAIFVHTVVAYIFAMTLRPGWNSTIYGPYFVFGAVFSGIAALLIVMAIFRKLCHLEEYITEKHFRNISYLLITLLFFYAYFTFSEYLTIGYKVEAGEKELLAQLMMGKMAGWFWFFVVGGLLVPAFLIVFRKLRVIPRVVAASVLVIVGMWVKRFIIVLGTLQVPLMPFEFGIYKPTWVEISVSLAALAGFVLLFALFTKIFPVISVWEVSEEAHHEQSTPADIPADNKPRLIDRLKRGDE